MRVTKVIAWSWNEISWAMIGEAASCNLSCPQIAMLSELDSAVA